MTENIVRWFIVRENIVLTEKTSWKVRIIRQANMTISQICWVAVHHWLPQLAGWAIYSFKTKPKSVFFFAYCRWSNNSVNTNHIVWPAARLGVPKSGFRAFPFLEREDRIILKSIILISKTSLPISLDIQDVHLSSPLSFATNNFSWHARCPPQQSTIIYN
jgi:hypothetical protein